MRRLLLFLLFASGLSAGVAINRASSIRDVYRHVCDLAEDNFYKADKRFHDWVLRCRLSAARVPVWTSKAGLLRDIQERMDEMQVSHFRVYDPGEDKMMWTGEASGDTGIRSRYVEDYLIVYKVFPDSAADDVGVRPGDEVLAIEGTDQVTPWGASTRSGRFRFKRGNEEFDMAIVARALKIDSDPVLKKLDGATAVLEISSFRGEYFEREKWKQTTAGLSNYKHIIIDLRENVGGNLVAMLRALSTFHCEGVLVGELFQPRKRTPEKSAMDDNTDDMHQIEEMTKHRKIGLVTYGGYGCYRGRVTVLVSSDTSSVSEIFANSFFYRPNSRVWGQPTAGDVVLAVWYDLLKLGPGYSVSIPEAVYLTPEQTELESSGVYPKKELFYDLKRAREGKDGWIEEARSSGT